jgi:BirA family biotin operon repressor/biotin-[acetyl-CoA-carboxylase] ligase
VLVPERVRTLLGPSTRFRSIEALPSIDSTNRLVADRAAAGAPEGLVVAAELQTAGRGRLDRSWEAASGAALLVSVLLRPAGLPLSRWFLLSAAAGVSAREACTRIGGFSPDLKWPNDLLVSERKLAGILAEATGGAAVVGMGLNVHAAPPGAAWADEAAGRRIDRSELLAAWLGRLDHHLGRWDDLLRAYRRACSTLGQQVVVEQGHSRLHGRAEDIDDDGRLVVRVTGGGQVAVSAGDVTHVRTSPGTPAPPTGPPPPVPEGSGGSG